MNQPAFQHIGVIPNLQKEGAKSILSRLVPDLLGAGFKVCIDKSAEPFVPHRLGVGIGIEKPCDLLVAIGGDGTMLMVARRYLDWDVPILGLKGGRLGFLTEAQATETARRIKEGRYQIQTRMRITATVIQGGEKVRDFNALNDVVVHVAGSSRIARMRTSLNGTLIREYSADGVIIATPTGSTAYSLSAGGPVLWPMMEAIMLTPLAAHTLSVRPLVLGTSDAVTIDILTDDISMRVTVDGQKGMDLEPGQKIIVERSSKITRLLVPDDYDFFDLLREKL